MQSNRSFSRRHIMAAALAIGSLSAALCGIAPAFGAPIEIRYFYRAPWPSSETYANWLINEWNKANGDRIHVTGASVDGETYKTKQTIELASSNPPDVFYSWEGGRAAEVIKNGFAADLTPYYAKSGGINSSFRRALRSRRSATRSTSFRPKLAPRLSGIARISTRSSASRSPRPLTN